MKAAAECMSYSPENSTAELTKNWDNVKNENFDFDQDLESTETFKYSRRGSG